MRFVCDFFGQVLQPNCSAFTLFSRLSCDTCQSNIVFICYYQVAFFFSLPKDYCLLCVLVCGTHTHIWLQTRDNMLFIYLNDSEFISGIFIISVNSESSSIFINLSSDLLFKWLTGFYIYCLLFLTNIYRWSSDNMQSKYWVILYFLWRYFSLVSQTMNCNGVMILVANCCYIGMCTIFHVNEIDEWREQTNKIKRKKISF